MNEFTQQIDISNVPLLRGKPCYKCGLTYDISKLIPIKYTSFFICEKCSDLYDNTVTRFKKLNRSTRSKISNSRKDIMNILGAKCSCCGETIVEFLTIEHIGLTGSFHRKQKKHNVYKHILEQGCPKDKYAILCMNCNWASRFNGICPHKHNT